MYRTRNLHLDPAHKSFQPSMKQPSGTKRQRAMKALNLCVICIAFSLSYSRASPVNDSVTFSQWDVIKKHLPLVPEHLTLGDVPAQRKSHRGLVKPLFVIGSDERSIDWLLRHKTTLESIQAVGFLIEVSHLEAVKSIFKLAHPLPISLGKDDIFVNALEVTHYPFLWHKGGIEQ